MRAPAAEPLTLLAILRLMLGAMFVWVFFENLGKGLYTPEGYASLIRYYIEKGSAPLAWKAVMGFMAGHATIAAPLQATAELGFGVLLVLGLASQVHAQNQGRGGRGNRGFNLADQLKDPATRPDVLLTDLGQIADVIG